VLSATAGMLSAIRPRTSTGTPRVANRPANPSNASSGKPASTTVHMVGPLLHPCPKAASAVCEVLGQAALQAKAAIGARPGCLTA
jgi:hypothetical protein